MSAERWKPVVGFEGSYEVSDLGRVRSLDRVIHSPVAKRGYPKRVTGRLLKPQRHSSGYVQFTLSKGVHLGHRLVARAFLGSCPTGHEVCHLDGDKRNNRVCNLLYGTAVENAGHRLMHGTESRGERNGAAKLTQPQILNLRSRAARGETYETLAAELPVGSRCVGKIVRRERWTHV